MKTHRPHVLVADDDRQVLSLFSRLLTKGGYAVTSVDSGSGVMKVLRDKPVDLLVLDLDMPRPDGFEILRMLRKERPGLRVLAVSGVNQGAFLEASEFLGATASLSKTEAPGSLVRTVNALLQ